MSKREPGDNVKDSPVAADGSVEEELRISSQLVVQEARMLRYRVRIPI